MRNAILAVAVLAAASALSSCRSLVGARLEPGESAYVGGELTALEKAPFVKVVPATKNAMTRLGLNPILADHDGHHARYLGTSSNGKDVYVNLERKSDVTTRIGIRILFTRDAARVRQILDEIRKRVHLPEDADTAVVRSRR